MEPGDTPIQRVRFGAFEADLRAAELFRRGRKIKLPGQPFQVLSLLLEQAGQVVTREELQARIWPGNTFVDFDHSLNKAIQKIREALGDDAASPRFVETLPRRGYRFIARVELAGANGDSEVAPQAAAESPQPRTRLAKWKWAAGVGFVVLIALGALIFHFQSSPTPPVLAFQRRDWVLVSRFENRTGNPVLNGTVDFAVAQELSNSKFVNVVPPRRIGDALHLMEKPLNTPLTPAVAREVCLRDGGIRALITGRVEKIGTNYVLNAGIVDPATDVQVAGVESQASDLNGILPAVRQLSNQLRAALGEDLSTIRESKVKLERVTTPSLRALQLYSQADAIAIEQAPEEKPIPFLEQALADDPNFASAHVLLAWCYSNIGKQALAAPHWEKAFELASTVSERERLFILGSYYQRFKGDQAKAIQEYEALVRLYPDNYWGINNLQSFYVQEGLWGLVDDLAFRLADLRPTDFRRNVTALMILSITERDARARHFLQRDERLMTPEIAGKNPDMTAIYWGTLAEIDLRTGKIKAALDVVPKLEAIAGPGNSAADRLSALYYQMGMLKLAAKWVRAISPDDSWRHEFAADVAFERNDLAAERKALEQPLTKLELQDDSLAPKFVQCGMLREARRQVIRYEKWHAGQKGSGGPEWGEGSLALAEGRYAEAVRLLNKFLQRRPRYNFWELGAEPPEDDLATAYEREGKIADAIQTLQPLEAKGYLSPRASFHLYNLYLKSGDARDAQKVKADLLHRLAYADPDYPVLVELRHDEGHHVAALVKH